MRPLLAVIVAVALGCALATTAPALAQIARATVTIEGVRYTLPAAFRNHALRPRNPLCFVYEYFYITIVGRELYINGELKYRAKPGDDVVVAYPQGVRVNGQPAPPQEAKRFDWSLCRWAAFPP